MLAVAIVLNPPESVCHGRNRAREDRTFGPHVVRQQRSQLRYAFKTLKREGFRHIFVLDSVEAIDAASIERVPLWNDKQHEHGPFDFVGDVHGCCDELEQLLLELGYRPRSEVINDSALLVVRSLSTRKVAKQFLWETWWIVAHVSWTHCAW